ncbi:hypothetical protein AbraIFM66950_011681 [Aspergillus brasiliensis]|nr:hypothetical protein AbraIFM66950_011681 [Aspergillus brasiliensis]
MFKVCPSPVLERPDAKEWYIDGMSHDLNDRLILDTHFLGLTPLHDHSPLQAPYDCLAISGLASHPFGSWQPKEDRRYMWILDELARSEQSVRAILYGYDTRLEGSQSFQTISDLARQLIEQLLAYRAPGSVTPLAFLAHSLGGLVVKQALRDLAENYSDKESQDLLSAVRGAIFFGVPNTGMRQKAMEAIVGHQPNKVLVGDLSKNSKFIKRLAKAFPTKPFYKNCKFFWAYETEMSPTVTRNAANRLIRDGPAVKLVSEKSATCGFIKTNSTVIFPINFSHSNMVKFSQDSHYLGVVQDKLSQILQIAPHGTSYEAQGSNVPHIASNDVTGLSYRIDSAGTTGSATTSLQLGSSSHSSIADVEMFKRNSGLTESEAKGFAKTTQTVLLPAAREITQSEQWHNNQPTLITQLDQSISSMEKFGQVAQEIDSFSNGSNTIGNERIKEANTTAERPQLFDAPMRDFNKSINEVSQSVVGTNWLISNQKEGLMGPHAQKPGKWEMEKVHRDTVEHWLSALDVKAEHQIHQEKRKRVCKDPGRWLLSSPRFKTWANPDSRQNSLLWLSGIPGAGKSVLASVVIDGLSNIQGATVAYFYCKYGSDQHNSLESVTRSAHMNEPLTSSAVSERILCTSLRSCTRVFLVLDGLDECGRAARKAIVSRFRRMVLSAVEVGSIRCLFISQEDDAAVEDFQGIQSIKIGKQNSDDISEFASMCQQNIIAKFGASHRLSHIGAIILKQSQGMFLFAELFVKYLEQWSRLKGLKKQLRPKNLPAKLDDLYALILSRICKARGGRAMRLIEEMLGWIACARRPLRWKEIQTTACIDPRKRNFDDGRRLGYSPRELFASLVEHQSDDTVNFIHGTARQFLMKRSLDRSPRQQPVVEVHQAHFSLAMRLLTYLSFSQFVVNRPREDTRSDLLSGFYQLYEYASAFWVVHLEESLPNLAEEKLVLLRQALERLVEVHWSKSHQPIHDSEVRTLLSPLERLKDTDLEQFNKLIQAVAWAKKQSGPSGIKPSTKEALTLWRSIAGIRSVLQEITPTGKELETIDLLYGIKRYKCPWVNCQYYHYGFHYAEQEARHIKKHKLPYLCLVMGCPKEASGYKLEKDLKEHLL